LLGPHLTMRNIRGAERGEKLQKGVRVRGKKGRIHRSENRSMDTQDKLRSECLTLARAEKKSTSEAKGKNDGHLAGFRVDREERVFLLQRRNGRGGSKKHPAQSNRARFPVIQNRLKEGDVPTNIWKEREIYLLGVRGNRKVFVREGRRSLP